jgi:hypothetical protein
MLTKQNNWLKNCNKLFSVFMHVLRFTSKTGVEPVSLTNQSSPRDLHATCTWLHSTGILTPQVTGRDIYTLGRSLSLLQCSL